MKKQHLTIHDIARKLNVSASTVSRALQNNPRISKATRDAVQKLAAEHNYQPNVMASSLRRGKSNIVGVIIPRINRNFFSNVIGGMEEIFASSGINLIICQTHEKYKDEVEVIQTLINARVDAIIISISLETVISDHLKLPEEHGIRLLFFDRFVDGFPAGSVVVDDIMGAYISIKHLLEQGYRKIIHVTESDNISIYKDRKAGYMKAMKEAGIDVQPSWIIEKPLDFEGGESAFNIGMAMSKKPDAYFCAGDFAALGVLKAAQKRGLRIPDDVGITGFANEPFTAFLEPSLTTVDQRSHEMGKIVAKRLLQCEEDETMSTNCEQIVLQPELIIRNSSLLINS